MDPRGEKRDRENEEMEDISSLQASLGFFDVHVSEVFCPGKFTARAASYGLNAGHAYDLAVAGPDGQPRDLSREYHRALCDAEIEREDPYLLVGSPMCKAFSQIMNLNK